MDTVKTIKTALTHAEFKDPDIGAAVDKLLTKLGDELDAVGYDAGSEVEEAAEEVDTAITTYEEGLEGLPVAAELDAEDEFEGLGDDEDEAPIRGPGDLPSTL